MATQSIKNLFTLSPDSAGEKMERAARIELASSAWKAEVLPLHNARGIYFAFCEGGGEGWIRTNVHIVIRFTV